jgi:hypothetical protein
MRFDMKKICTYLLIALMTGPVAAFCGEIDLHYSEILNSRRGDVEFVQVRNSQQDRAFIDVSEGEQTGGPSTTKAMLLTFLLPGAGQYYAGATTRGQVFMGVEAAIWAGFAAYRIYGGWKEDDYKAYAATYAGVDNSGKSDNFYDYVGFYNSREEYNQFSRLYTPSNPYYPDTPTYDWNWQSDVQREEFRDIRNSSKTAFRNSTFMIGLAIANRVVAGIDTYRIVKKAKSKTRLASQFGAYKIKFKPRPFSADPSVTISISRKF